MIYATQEKKSENHLCLIFGIWDSEIIPWVFKAARLNYWRTKDKAEVDFVVEAGKRLIPVEVKYKYLKQDKVPVSLRSFIDKYSPQQAYIINIRFSKTFKISNTTVTFMPFHELLRENTMI